MCGRYTMFADDAELVNLFDIDVVEGEHKPSYNQAPSQVVRTVRTKSDERRELGLMSWGLVPFWAKESFKPLINARAETVTEKPSFRTAVSKRRCLIPANGYYEWQETADGRKQPWFLSLATPDGEAAPPGAEPTMAMAGIFDWPNRQRDAQLRADGRGPDVPASVDAMGVEGAPEDPATCAIITREAVDTLGEIHPRMPLFIPRSLWAPWLDMELRDPKGLKELIASIPVAPLAPRMVGPAVGNVRNNSPELLAPYDPDEGLLLR